MLELIQQLVHERRRKLLMGESFGLEDLVLRKSWASDPLDPAQRLSQRGLAGALLGAALSTPVALYLGLFWMDDLTKLGGLALIALTAWLAAASARKLSIRSIANREIEDYERWLLRSERHVWVEYTQLLQSQLRQSAGNKALGTEADRLAVARQLERIQNLIDAERAEPSASGATTLGLLAAEAKDHVDQFLIGSDHMTHDLDQRLPEEVKRELLRSAEEPLSKRRSQPAEG